MLAALVAAGSNAQGQLANASLDDAHRFLPSSFDAHAPGTLPPHTARILALAGGANHTVALLERLTDDGTPYTELWGAGDGRRGQLGPGAPPSSPTFRRLALPLPPVLDGHACRLVAAGWETTYLVFSRPGAPDVLLAMGADDFGDLGVGGGQGSGPHVVPLAHLRVRGQALDPAVLAVTALAAGTHHAVAVLATALADGSPAQAVVGWGTARHGQLGARTTPAGRPLPAAARPAVLPAPAGDPVAGAALGTRHTVLLHASGRVTALGADTHAQVSAPAPLAGVRAVGCTWGGTYALGGGGGAVRAAGQHARGQLGRARPAEAGPAPLGDVQFPWAPGARAVEGIACGSEHVLVLVGPGDGDGEREREVWGWGWNEHGNLGVGTTTDVELPVRIWPPVSSPSEGRAVGVWAGCGTSWIAVEKA